jgi:hypothetical protein
VTFTNQTEIMVEDDDTWQIATNKKTRKSKETVKDSAKEMNTKGENMVRKVKAAGGNRSGTSSLLKAVKTSKEPTTREYRNNIVNPYKTKKNRKRKKE